MLIAKGLWIMCDELLLLTNGSGIYHNYYQWSVTVKGCKKLCWLIEWLHVGSTNYVDTLRGQPITILVPRHGKH